MSYDVKRMAGIRRELRLREVATVGPGHGRAKTHTTAKDKNRNHRLQRRTWKKEI